MSAAAAVAVESGLSLVRLDPLQNVFELRAYGLPVDPSRPLAEMRARFVVSGLVTIVAGTALVTKVTGTITRCALRDFDDRLRAMGVQRVVWERHRVDGTIKYVERTL